LLAYCAGRLEPAAALAVQRHLAECPACRRFHEAQQAVWSALDDWESHPVSDDFDRRLYQRIEQEDRAPVWQRWIEPLRAGLARHVVLPLAAAACLLFTASVILERPRQVSKPAAEVRAEAVQPDQVESTLEDLEMLHDISMTQRSETGAM
jgi:anti-sigma factor RsiW